MGMEEWPLIHYPEALRLLAMVVKVAMAGKAGMALEPIKMEAMVARVVMEVQVVLPLVQMALLAGVVPPLRAATPLAAMVVMVDPAVPGALGRVLAQVAMVAVAVHEAQEETEPAVVLVLVPPFLVLLHRVVRGLVVPEVHVEPVARAEQVG